jgi:hypothetical protein
MECKDASVHHTRDRKDRGLYSSVYVALHMGTVFGTMEYYPHRLALVIAALLLRWRQ